MYFCRALYKQAAKALSNVTMPYENGTIDEHGCNIKMSKQTTLDSNLNQLYKMRWK